MPEEWLHTHIRTEGRGVPCEVLEGVVGRDGDALVRESYLGYVHLFEKEVHKFAGNCGLAEM
jgi:hypothetical protein